MGKEHEQSVWQEEKLDGYQCRWCGGKFESSTKQREHTCTTDNGEPARLSVHPNR